MAPRNHQILIVEDTTSFAIVLRRLFRRVGFAVTVATDGREAWERSQLISFDVIVTDQQMPQMCGTDLLLKLRQTDAYARTPFFLVTAKAYELDLPGLSSELGICEVFVKPFKPSALELAVRQSLVGLSPAGTT